MPFSVGVISFFGSFSVKIYFIIGPFLEDYVHHAIVAGGFIFSHSIHRVYHFSGGDGDAVVTYLLFRSLMWLELLFNSVSIHFVYLVDVSGHFNIFPFQISSLSSFSLFSICNQSIYKVQEATFAFIFGESLYA